MKIGCFEDVIKSCVFQSRLAEYGFAARYKGPIGKKAVEEKERSVSLEAEELSDSGNKTFLRNWTTLNFVNPHRTVFRRTDWEAGLSRWFVEFQIVLFSVSVTLKEN